MKQPQGDVADGVNRVLLVPRQEATLHEFQQHCMQLMGNIYRMVLPDFREVIFSSFPNHIICRTVLFIQYHLPADYTLIQYAYSQYHQVCRALRAFGRSSER
jgi:hypothetical protein